MQLARFARIRVAHLPTPLERLDRLTEALGGPEIWIKRDDCTGLSTGGNKTRKLEFLMADAVAQGADIVVTQGATQSNHARQTAAFTARLGLDCHILLEDRTGYTAQEYTDGANVFLDRLHGASVERHPGGTDMNAKLAEVAEAIAAKGRRPYAIPGGGSNPIGALGYVDAAMELVRQADDSDLAIDHVVHATGSAGTQAGLVVGLKAMNAAIPVLGIGVRAPKAQQEDNVFRLAAATAKKIGCDGLVARGDIVANTDYVGDGYGLPTDAMLEAIEMFAKLEGLLLDPVYSGKGAAGLIDLVRKGHFSKGERIVFLHTGGAAGLFGYTHAFRYAADAALA